MFGDPVDPDDLTYQDMVTYGMMGDFYNPSAAAPMGRQAKARPRAGGDFDYVEEEDEDDDIQPLGFNGHAAAAAREPMRKKINHPIVLVQPPRPEPPDIAQLIKQVGAVETFNAPEELDPFQDHKVIVPYRTLAAADTLLSAMMAGELALGQQTVQELQMISKCTDEFTMIDPPVCITDTLETDTCRIYLKEVVPVSLLVLALHLGLTYRVELIPGRSSRPKSYDQVTVKACKKIGAGQKPLHQPFHLRDAIFPALGRENEARRKMILVQIYFARKGAISSFDAADLSFLEVCKEDMPMVLDNKPIIRRKPE